MFQPKSYGAITLWPRLEIGKGSAIPCRAPSTIAWKKEMGSIRARAAYAQILSSAAPQLRRSLPSRPSSPG